MKKNSPCYKCERRTLTCHHAGQCEEWEKHLKEKEKEYHERMVESAVNIAIFVGIEKRSKYARKK